MTPIRAMEAFRGVDLDGAEPQSIIAVTDKTVVARGYHRGRHAVLKVLRSSEQSWRTRFHREQGLYQQFQAHPPPVRVPALYYSNGDDGLVLELLTGRPAKTDRIPAPLPEPTLRSVVTTVQAFSAWEPEVGVLQPVLDYEDRIHRYRATGWLTREEATVLRRLLAGDTRAMVVQHGDPIPNNVLVEPSGLVDWEFAGLYLPGWDLAVLHTLLGRSPTVCAWIEECVAQARISDAFLLNKALVVTRELRLLEGIATTLEQQRRLAMAQAQWERTRMTLRQRS